MKKLLLLFVFCSVVVSCGSTFSLYSDSNYWYEIEILPSEVRNYYNVMGRLPNGKNYRLINQILGEDGEYYYELLMKDFGWWENEEGGFSASPNDNRRTNKGSLYISSKRGVAIYFLPKGTYLVYEVEIYD